MDEKGALHFLRDLLRREKLPHAFLLLGESEPVAAFAKNAASLLLDSDSPFSPDLSWEEIPATGQQESHSAAELRDRIQASLQLRPVGKRRVLALLGIEKLSPEARDALLKPLEEPPPNTVILLGAPDANSVPETIRSRCRVLRLSTIPAANAPASGAWREIAARIDGELATSSRFDPGPHLGMIFGSKRAELAARREKAKEFLHSWIALQRGSWRSPECRDPQRAESMTEAALVALGDLKRQITPELALGGMFFFLAGRGNFATE